MYLCVLCHFACRSHIPKWGKFNTEQLWVPFAPDCKVLWHLSFRKWPDVIGFWSPCYSLLFFFFSLSPSLILVSSDLATFPSRHGMMVFSRVTQCSDWPGHRTIPAFPWGWVSFIKPTHGELFLQEIHGVCSREENTRKDWEMKKTRRPVTHPGHMDNHFRPIIQTLVFQILKLSFSR